MIPISQPFLPPQKEYEEYISGIWKRNWLTNMGPLASELEMKLKFYLNVNHLLFVTNGTIALQMAIKVLELSGEIITTPFTFVATSSSIVWEGCKPVFVDIERDTLNIDASKIEAAITPATTAIMATHVYGNPCDVIAIQQIADKHNLKVIYDGAHAFGVKVGEKSIFEYGDISTCSLHATKLYHSIEGGLIITKDAEILKNLASMRNFGYQNHDSFLNLGINGKNSEFHAAMGLINLPYVTQIRDKNKVSSELYDKHLKTLKAKPPKWFSNSTKAYSYYPLIFESKETMLEVIQFLESQEIFTRRYFYPALSQALPYLEPTSLEVADSVSERVLCLPLYFDLSETEINLICRLILRVQNN